MSEALTLISFMNNITIIGGGAAGMMAACAAAGTAENVRILEKNEKLGKKIYITGKGRCNYTNTCDFNTFIENIVSNPKFMYSSLKAFGQSEMTEFLEMEGCKTKVERGQRAFPFSDHASDVTKALESYLKRNGVKIELNTEVVTVEKIEAADSDLNNADCKQQDMGFRVISQKKNGKRAVYAADSVIIATGGLSYPSTGSTGDGYSFAKTMGLSVKKPAPALVPLVTEDRDNEHAALQGVSLKNVSIAIYEDRKTKPFHESDTGELLFTHFGLSGPLILSASSLVTGGLENGKYYRLCIDLKPALSEKQLDERILRDFEGSMNMNIENALSGLLISSLRPVVLKRAGIDAKKKVRDIDRSERQRLVENIKKLSFDILGTRGFNEAIVTQGGVCINELNPKTLEAKKCKGLFFAGEVLDVDAYTGGFNLQIAWSTGHAAGTAAAEEHSD